MSAPLVSCIALTAGVPPETPKFSLENLIGPQSLFGEKRFLPDSMPVREAFVLPETLQEAFPEYGESRLLWSGNATSTHFGDADYTTAASTFLVCDTASTFSLAWKLHALGLLPPWGAVLATRQTEGRGQMRRHWHSPPGNLYVTFRLPDDPLFFSGPAPLLTGYLCVKAFSALGIGLQIKWPNDLLTLAGKKTGGILIEERDGVLLAGVGINLLSAPDPEYLRKEAASPAGTIREAAEDKIMLPAPFFLWRSLVARFVVEYTHAVTRRSAASLVADIEPYLAWKGQRVSLADADGTMITGVYDTISPDGGILLKEDSGRSRQAYSGSLSRA